MRMLSKFLTTLFWCIGLAVPAGYVSGASAQNFTSMCKGDDALVGIAVALYVVTDRNSNPMQPILTPVYINMVQASCAPLEDGELGKAYTAEAPVVMPTLPFTTPSGSGAKACGTGKVVKTMQGATVEGRVNDFRFGCGEPGADGQLRFTKGPSNADFEDQCGDGQYAHGITGVPSSPYGFAELGLKCIEMKASHKDDNEEENTDEGENGGDDNGFSFGKLHFQIDVNGATIKFGKKGKVRVVDEATTIYKNKGEDDLDYLDAGDKVVVVACEDDGQGWCAIVKPKVGYVWGADLK